jgi:hypothetical protein
MNLEPRHGRLINPWSHLDATNAVLNTFLSNTPQSSKSNVRLTMRLPSYARATALLLLPTNLHQQNPLLQLPVRLRPQPGLLHRPGHGQRLRGRQPHHILRLLLLYLLHSLRTHHQHRRGRELYASNTDATDPGEQCREGVQLLLPIGQSIGLSERQRDKYEREQPVVPRRGREVEYHRADMHRGDRATGLCGGVGDIVCFEEEGE